MARSELRSNQKFKRLVHHLKLPAPYVMGLLECMWQCGYASGNDLLGDASDVEIAAEWPGAAGEFFKVMISECWIDERDGKFHIHDLFDHAPEYVQKRMTRRNDKGLRSKTADNGRRSADNGRRSADNGRRSADNGRQTAPNGGSTQPNPTQPNPTQPNPTQPRFYPADVEAIYAAYPRKVGSAAAKLAISRALVKLVPRNVEPDPVSWLLERVHIYARSPAGNEGKFTPHPSTWFNEGRFDDDQHEWNKEKPDAKQTERELRRARECPENLTL